MRMENRRTSVCHFTSAHDAYDDRIYLKECISLEKAGYEVFLAVKGKNTAEEGIQIVGCGMPRNRFERILLFSRKVYKKALGINADIYHFHDPELLPYALKLKRKGKKVIFDSHEDVPSQILDKDWIPVFLRRIISGLYKMYESHVVKRLDAVVAATPHIAEQFKGRAKIVEVVNNYPKLDDIIFHDKPFAERKKIVCYAGGIGEIRGENVMVEAMMGIDADLVLAGDREGGPVTDTEDRRVRYLGKISRKEVNELYGSSRVGMLLYQPAQNHYEAQPIKMFEYMAAGLPFVASNFPLWKSIVEQNGCGICVDPQNVEEVREACRKLVSDPEMGQHMGSVGRKAVMEKYNWKNEEQKLFGLYTNLANNEKGNSGCLF